MLPFLLLTVTILSSCFTQIKKGRFEITGTLSGFADSTLIYIDDPATTSARHMDSTLLINSQFYFRGSIKEDAKNVILRTSNYSDYKYFWLENSAITFEAEKDKFRQAVIIGSGTQTMQNELDAAINRTGNEKEQSIAFISGHPNSIISAHILSVYASTWGKDTSTILYNKLSKKMKSTPYGKNILEFITLNKEIKIGDQFIDFTQPDIEGKNISLSDFNGKVILLEFWGSWCGPCREGHPELVKIYTEFRNRGFDILGVASEDNKEDWTEAVSKDGLTWQNVSDLRGNKNKAAIIYGISYYPANFLIDRKGSIVARDLAGEDLRKKLEEMLE